VTSARRTEFVILALIGGFLAAVVLAPALDDGSLGAAELIFAILIGLASGSLAVWLADRGLGLISLALILVPLVLLVRADEAVTFVGYFLAMVVGVLVTRWLWLPGPSRSGRRRHC
jgi:hypothetical protein